MNKMMSGILEILEVIEELKSENKKLKTMLDDADLYISDIKIQKEIVLQDNRKLREENKKLKESNFSLNDYVSVKLINDGEKILIDYYSKCKDCGRKFVFKIHNYNEGWIKIQLWQLFDIFGRYIHMGNNKLPFEISNCRLEAK